MAFISLKCPSCGADIELDEKREFGFCSYCGTKIMQDKQVVELKGKVKVDGVSTADKLLERANILVEDKEYSEAESYFNKVLELEPKCAKAYWGKMLCEYRIPYAKTAEIKGIDITKSNNYNRAVMYATGKQKDKYIEYGEKAAGTYGANEQAEIDKQKKAVSRSTWLKIIFAIAPVLTFIFLFVVIISDFNIITKIINLLFGIAWFVSCVLVRKDLKQKIGAKPNIKWLLNNLWSAAAGILVVGCVLVAFLATPASEEPTDDKTNVKTTVSVTETITETEPEPTTEPPVEITAEKLLKAYQENEINASEKYKDRYLKVTGYVDNIGRSDNVFLSDSYYVYIDDGNPYNFNDIRCSLNDESIEAAAEIKSGDKVVIIGRCEGFSITSVDMYDCTIVE